MTARSALAGRQSRLRAVLGALDRNGERWLLLVFYVAIVLIVTSEVARRFLLADSSVWGGEASRFLFIYLAWVGASAAVRERSHIRIDAVLQWLPPRGKSSVLIFGDLMTLVLAIIAVYWSLSPLETSWQFGSVAQGLQVSRVWFLAAVPLGFGMMIFRLLQAMLRDVSDLRTGREPFEGSKLFD